jgi:hypothetical protein
MKERSDYWEAVIVGKLAPCHKKTWELNFHVCSIFKPNAPLAKVVEYREA